MRRAFPGHGGGSSFRAPCERSRGLPSVGKPADLRRVHRKASGAFTELAHRRRVASTMLTRTSAESHGAAARFGVCPRHPPAFWAALSQGRARLSAASSSRCLCRRLTRRAGVAVLDELADAVTSAGRGHARWRARGGPLNGLRTTLTALAAPTFLLADPVVAAVHTMTGTSSVGGLIRISGGAPSPGARSAPPSYPGMMRSAGSQ